MSGQLIATLTNETKMAASYKLTFNAGNLPTAMYIYRLEAGGKSLNRKKWYL